MANMRYIRQRVISLARVIATSIPIYTVQRGEDVVMREKYAENGVLIGVVAHPEGTGVEADEYYITRDGEYLKLARRRADGPRGEVHLRREVHRVTQGEAIDAVGAAAAGQAVLALIRKRKNNTESRLRTLTQAEEEMASHLARPDTVACDAPIATLVVIEELEEELA
jgi:hypothetical protein